MPGGKMMIVELRLLGVVWKCNLLEDFVGVKFYCRHTIADSNWQSHIREKMLELLSTMLSALSHTTFFIVYTTTATLV